jgi:hypothetical protein
VTQVNTRNVTLVNAPFVSLSVYYRPQEE